MTCRRKRLAGGALAHRDVEGGRLGLRRHDDSVALLVQQLRQPAPALIAARRLRSGHARGGERPICANPGPRPACFTDCVEIGAPRVS